MPSSGMLGTPGPTSPLKKAVFSRQLYAAAQVDGRALRRRKMPGNTDSERHEATQRMICGARKRKIAAASRPKPSWSRRGLPIPNSERIASPRLNPPT